MTWPLQALLVFVAMMASDFCWARYIVSAAGGRRLVAATWSAAIMLIGSITVIEYTSSHWMILPATAGAFTGTLIAVKRKHESAA